MDYRIDFINWCDHGESTPTSVLGTSQRYLGTRWGNFGLYHRGIRFYYTPPIKAKALLVC